MKIILSALLDFVFSLLSVRGREDPHRGSRAERRLHDISIAYKKGFFTNPGVAAEVISMSGRLAMPASNNGVRACTNTGVEAMLKIGKTMKRLTLLFFVALLPFTGYSSAQESVEGKGQSIKRKIEEVISGYLTELNGKYKFGSPA